MCSPLRYLFKRAARARDGRPSSPFLSARWLSALAVLALVTLYYLSADRYHLPLPQPPDLGGPKQPTTTMAPKPKPTARPQPSQPAVTLKQGRYISSVILASSHFPRPIDAFRGIPFAQDTGGPNRFRPPQPLPASDKTFDALRFGKFCPRDNFLRGDSGEDCLNLNVYRPSGVVDANGASKGRKGLLPVIVYVHGGAFNSGSGIERNMASFVSWAEQPMVGINFNYRVGALGFLPSEVTAREGLLNLGLRDQQALFEWVKENVEAFGGDPENVTIMGLSAGAHSVGLTLGKGEGRERG
jgi:hypothetical protein